MRRFLTILVLLALLTGCSAPAEETAEPQAAQAAPEEQAPEVREAPEGLELAVEHAVYDPSMEYLTYFVRNGTEETVDFGEEYSLQRQENGGWKDLSFAENTGFDDIGYELAPGGTAALTCWLGMLRDTPEEGAYRLVKTVGGAVLYGEFSIGESPYTADTPYGFAALEDLPSDYGAAAAAEADVVFTGSGERNLEAAEEFLDKVSLGASCQLRTVQDYGEGAAMVTDVIYEDGCFLWRMRGGGDGEVTELRFSYLVTDGGDLYLSNGADWDSGEKYGDRRTLLLPEGTVSAALVPRVEEMTADRLARNVTRYKVWSADGVYSAALKEDSSTAFSVRWQKPGEGSGGDSYDLQDWDGLETAILAIRWQADDTLRLTCQRVDGGRSQLTFDPESGQLTSEST